MAYLSSSPVQPSQGHNRRLPSLSWNSTLFDANPPSSPGSINPGSAATRLHSNSKMKGASGGGGGQLSPTFDQTFQSSMNISGTAEEEDEQEQDDDGNTTPLEHGDPLLRLKVGVGVNPAAAAPAASKDDSSPHAMDISPAPPTATFAFNPLPLSRASSNSNSTSRPTSSSSCTQSGKAFDNTFFAKLTANQPSSSGSSSVHRSRTRSADVPSQPLAPKDANEQPSNASNGQFPSFPLKRPTGLLRTASAQAKSNPFEVSPRFPGAFAPLARPGLMERARSDGGLVFGQDQANKRAPSATTGTGPMRPAPGPYPLQASSGRRISGSSRVRSALPTEWASNSNNNKLDVPSALHQPPRLCHTLSAPIVQPLDWGHLSSQKSSSDSAVPTRRTLGTDFGSRLAREVMNASSSSSYSKNNADVSSSPNGMDIDPCSPRVVPAPSTSQRNSRQALACSPGLGDLFEENGVELSSPDAISAASRYPVAAGNSRKRGAMDDPDSSLNEINPGSPLQLTNNPLVAKPRPRALHRATSAAVLGSTSSSSSSSSSSTFGRRGAAARSASGTWAPGALSKKLAAAAAAGDSEDAASGANTRYRKVSRGADGRPNIIKVGAGRRAQSMCDSEFYASPPLGGADMEQDSVASGAGYFGMSHPSHAAVQAVHDEGGEEEEETEELNDGSGYLAPPPPAGLLSPPRPVLAPSKLKTYQPSPEANMKAGFGETEMKGKILPCFPVTDDGLMRISPATLNCLLAGEYDELIDAYCVIDCRFEYEFAGGHVEGAINLSTSSAIESFLLSSGPDSLFPTREEMPHPTRSGEICPSSGSKRKTILIFHCEFSAKRAPTLAGHLRCKDRTMNIGHYPAVHYPDVYVLHGGYAEYWKQYPETCDPRGYTPMDHPSHLPTRSKGIAELRKNRMGTRTHSYTYGVRSDLLRAQLDQEKHGDPGNQSNTAGAMQMMHQQNRPASSSMLQNSFMPTTGAAGSTRPTSSGNMSLFKGLIGGSKLTVQHEGENEDEDVDIDEEEGGESSAEAENSFTATKHGLPSSVGFDDCLAQSSSPCAGGSPGMPLGAAARGGGKMLTMMGAGGDSPLAAVGKAKPPMIHTSLFQQFNQQVKMGTSSGNAAGQKQQGAGSTAPLRPARGFGRAYTSAGEMFG